jgi:hypothetical protein
MKRYLWVVEMKEDGQWVSTVWVGIGRQEARQQQKDCRFQNAGEQTRIVKYVPEGK